MIWICGFQIRKVTWITFLVLDLQDMRYKEFLRKDKTERKEISFWDIT